MSKYTQVTDNIFSDGKNHFVVIDNKNNCVFPKSLQDYNTNKTKYPNIADKQTNIINSCIHKPIKIKQKGFINELKFAPYIDATDNIVAHSPDFTINDAAIDTVLKEAGYKFRREIIEITLTSKNIGQNLNELGITYYGRCKQKKREVILYHYNIKKASDLRGCNSEELEQFISNIQYNLNNNPLDAVFMHEKQHALNSLKQDILDNSKHKGSSKKVPKSPKYVGYGNIYDEISSRTAELLYYTDKYITEGKLPSHHNSILIDYFKTFENRPSNDVLLNIENISTFATNYWLSKNSNFYVNNDKSQVLRVMLEHSFYNPFDVNKTSNETHDKYINFFSFNINGKKYCLKKLPKIKSNEVAASIEKHSQRAMNLARYQQKLLLEANITEADINNLCAFLDQRNKNNNKSKTTSKIFEAILMKNNKSNAY